MLPRTRRALVAALMAQLASFGTLSAQTVWDGGGGDSLINTAANWNNDAVNALNGSQPAAFANSGATATLNVDGAFTTLTFNRNDVGGFTVNGPGALSVVGSGSGATANLSVSDTAADGVATVNASFKVNTDAGGTRLLVIDNRETGPAGASLVFAGGIAATNPANAYGLRFGGTGSTRIAGPLATPITTNIQQASVGGQNMAGTVTLAGNQSLGSAQVNIAGTSSGPVAATARFVMGDSLADLQSWASTTVNQAATVEIKSTATLTGGISLSNPGSGGASGGTLDVSGNLSATTLALGGAAYSGVLKVSGNASFSGALTSGATVGSKIIGGGVSTGTLTLASGTVGTAVALGGPAEHENNLALVKSATGTLTINSANNTYAGGTTIAQGGGSGSFAVALGAPNALGTGPLVIGTASTTGNGARLRLAGFSQTVSALSSGATTNARVIENFGATDSTLTVNQATDTFYSGFLRDRTSSSATATGTVSLVKDGPGTLTLTNTSNQHTGATILNGGVLEIAALSNGGIVKTITSTAGSNLVTTPDTTGLNPGMTFVSPTLPTGFAVSTVDSGTNLTLNTSAGITTGSGTAHFGLASSLGLSTRAAANLVFAGGTLRYTGSTTSSDRHFTILSGQIAKWDVANAAATLTLNGAATASTGGLEKLGPGSLTLAGANTYTGDTVVSAGTLLLGANGSVGTSRIVLNSGTTLDISGVTATSVTLGGGLGGGGTVLAPGKSLTVAGTFTPGALAVTGDLATDPAALTTFIASGSAATTTTVTVTGSFAPGGGLALAPLAGFSFAAGQSFTFVAASGGITAGYSAVTANGISLAESPNGVWSATNSGLIYTYTETTATLAVASASVLSPLQAWRESNFGTTENTGNAADSYDGNDNDGVPNLLEYALNGNPAVADASVLPRLTGSGPLRLTFYRNGDPGITYLVEARDDLVTGSWTQIYSSAGATYTPGLFEVADPGPVVGAKRFLRLRVTAP
jgi:fibronectin-binding autotransporter adhesin